MKKRWILLGAFCTSAITYAQVGIGTSNPNLSAQLEISSDTKGILIPQVTLKSLTDNTTISNGNVESLLVYNIANNGQLKAGYYYWKQNVWTRLLTEVEDKIIDFPTNSKFIVEDSVLKLYDSKNNFISIDIEQLNILTTLVKDASGNGKYTYTNESNTPVVIDVQADMINNFETVINNKDVQEVLNKYIVTNGGNVFYDGSNFIYKKADGSTETINITALVKAHETLTTLENVKTQEAQESGEIIDIYTLTYKDEAGDLHPIDIKVLVKGTETVTTLVYDPMEHVLTYKNEKGEVTNLKLTDLVGDGESLTKLEFDAATNSLLYTDEDGIIHTIEIESINKHPWLDSSTHNVATSSTADIYTKGWVGIGFTEPSGAPNEKLRVNGSITAVNSYYADYVFEKYFDGYSSLKYDYKFKSLDVVEDFIKENRHLPGITPIHELSKSEEGYSFNVSELSIQLLEKTEELYLHIIEQNKELEEKESRIKELEEVNQNVQQKVEQLEQVNQNVQQKVEQLEKMLLDFMHKN
jgi:hypothetical protein